MRCDGCCEVWQRHLNRRVDAVISKNAKKKAKNFAKRIASSAGSDKRCVWVMDRGAGSAWAGAPGQWRASFAHDSFVLYVSGVVPRGAVAMRA